MSFMFYDTPQIVVQYLMEDDAVWVAPRSWIKSSDALAYMNKDAHQMTLYNVFSPDFEEPIDTVWIIDSDYGFRLASDDEVTYLDNYLNAQV